MRTLQQWAREVPRALENLETGALVEVRATVDEAARVAQHNVRSARVEETRDGAILRTDDPRASALERVRYRYLGDALDSARADLSERLQHRAAEELTRG